MHLIGIQMAVLERVIVVDLDIVHYKIEVIIILYRIMVGLRDGVSKTIVSMQP